MDTISPEVKTALVTGTDHGVGFSLAKKLLSRGYFVIAVRVDETEKQIDEHEQTVNEVRDMI